MNDLLLTGYQELNEKDYEHRIKELEDGRKQVRQQLIKELGLKKAMEISEWDLLKDHPELREIEKIVV